MLSFNKKKREETLKIRGCKSPQLKLLSPSVTQLQKSGLRTKGSLPPPSHLGSFKIPAGPEPAQSKPAGLSSRIKQHLDGSGRFRPGANISRPASFSTHLSHTELQMEKFGCIFFLLSFLQISLKRSRYHLNKSSKRKARQDTD